MDLFSLLVFVGALFVATGSPGPNIAALVSRVLANGWRDVGPFLVGCWFGELIWLTCAILGLSALAQTVQPLFFALKWAGVCYLLWLAWSMWTAPVAARASELPRRDRIWPMFGAGMAVTLGNPKIMVFYVALLPTLIDMTAVGPTEWAILACITLAVMMIVDGTWVFAAQVARGFLRSPRAMRISNRTSAVAMGGAAALIAAR